MIPAAYRHLLTGRTYPAFATIMPDGHPQATVVWCDYDGTHLLINTMRGFQKEKNMRRNPRATLLAYEILNPLRALEVRGQVVEMSEEGALEHLDSLSQRYTGLTPYFGKCIPAEFQARETPVICRIQPTRVVTLDAGDATARTRARIGYTEPKSESHLDLLINPVHGVLTTLMPDGQPQMSIVWCDYDGTCARVNTTRERQKGKNMLRDPRVSLLVIDPEDVSRWIEIRGCVEITEEGTREHLDKLTSEYTGKSHYYGEVFPVERQYQETRILCKIHPLKIKYDAIHK